MTKAGYRPEAQPKPPTPPKTQKPKKHKKKKKKANAAVIASLIIFAVAAAIGAGTLFVYAQVERQAAVYAVGQMLDGHPMGGMTSEQGTALLHKLTDERVANWRYDVVCQGRSYAVTAADIGLFMDEGATLDPLWQVGKTGSVLDRFLQLVKTAQMGMNVKPVFGWNMEPIDALLAQIKQDTDCDPVDATIRYVPGSSEPFRFTKESMGYALDTSALRADIERALLALEPGSMEAVPQEIAPDVLQRDLEAAIVLRSRVVMTLDADEAALANVRLAAGVLNGRRIEAGEALSFNEAVGKRTAEGGYVAAPEPAFGAGVSGVGGGVSQVASALYQAALLGEMDVTERHAAVRPVGFCEMGQEAAVSDQGLDLVFTNVTDAPLFVTTRVYIGADEQPMLEIQLIGEAPTAQYMLQTQAIETTVIEEPVYVRDSEGAYATYTDERVPVSQAEPGYSVIVERVALDDNGQESAREIVSEDTYEPLAPMIYVGVTQR